MEANNSETRIPVVDLFAGPGGLSEGFSRYPYQKPDQSRFEVRLSIEKELQAHRTLQLRSFTRQFPYRSLPREYYQLLRETQQPLDDRLHKLYGLYPEQAKVAQDDALCAELGNDKYKQTIKKALGQALTDGEGRPFTNWILLGGPPCQAYSLVGRSRNRGIETYRPEDDHRHFLYQEYLRVIGEYLPSVFVMENVKGLLSATVNSERIFERMISDLQTPRRSLGIRRRKPKGVGTNYRLFALTAPSARMEQKQLFTMEMLPCELRDFVIRMERFGIPQARHRLIILGVREDLGIEKALPKCLEEQAPVPAKDVLEGLPRIRSILSKAADSEDAWLSAVSELGKAHWLKRRNQASNGNEAITERISSTVDQLTNFEFGRGSDWIACKPEFVNREHRLWFHDRKIKGVFNHESRGHIQFDLHRYLFASCYAQIVGRSPALRDYPEELLPNHQNVDEAVDGKKFADRFRVQLADRPSTTIMSHISKDGHYYIHPDPTQCRSLTVREAARLQTFPDNYFFCGPRTAQYVQVGNAVPPLLAHQIAEIVDSILVNAASSDVANIVDTKGRSGIITKIGSANTEPEMVVRKLLYAEGFRYRLHPKDLPGQPDLVLPRFRVAVLVKGCLSRGHNCKNVSWPSDNQECWRKKISETVARDQRNMKALNDLGWHVLTVWECAIKGRSGSQLKRLSARMADWIRRDAKRIRAKQIKG